MYPQQPDYSTQPHVAPVHVIPNRKQVDWRLAGAYIVAALAVGVACACLWLFHSYKVTVAGQMTQLRHAVVDARTAQSKDARNIKDLSGRVDGAEGQLTVLAPYSMTCSTDLEGPSGPTRYFFACTPHQPGSGS